MRHSVRAAIDPVDPFANNMGWSIDFHHRQLSRGLGRTIEFAQVPIAEVRKSSEDFALMLEWFDRIGYDADIEGLEREFGITPTKLAEWAGRQRG